MEEHATVPDPTPQRVLVVEDDGSLRDLISTALDFAGFEVATACNGIEALEQVPAFGPDLIVLDVMMPELDGLETCRRLRAAGDDTPIVFLTARGDPQDVVAGFEAGGDDHLAKPFHFKVLVARVESVLRRTSPTGRGGRNGQAPPTAEAASPGRHAYAGLELDERAHRVWRDRQPIALSPTEFKLLRYLLVNPEVVLSKSQIIDHLWQYDYDGETNIVETHMSYLRKKLGPPRLIQTVRGVGYVLRREEG